MINKMFNELPIPNCRKEYFRQYYLTNKNKYVKEERPIEKKKRGRPKKVIPPYTVTSGVYIVSWD